MPEAKMALRELPELHITEPAANGFVGLPVIAPVADVVEVLATVTLSALELVPVTTDPKLSDVDDDRVGTAPDTVNVTAALAAVTPRLLVATTVKE